MGAMASGDPFGTQIKRARERRHLTQQDLADRLGVDRKTIDNWENSRTYPRNRVGALEEWAPELAEGVDPDEVDFYEALGRLRENPLTKGLPLDALERAFKERKRRSRGDGAGYRAS